MIYTVTFNPALDVSGTVEEVVPNEKSYVSDEVHMAGGNGINAGIISARLGSKVTLTGFLGGPNGEEIRHLLSIEKPLRSFVQIKGRTRMNLTVSNRSDHQQTRLSFPGPMVSRKEAETLLKYLAEHLKERDLLLLGGSLPPGIDTSFVRKLILEAKKKKTICLVDMPGKLLKEVIDTKPAFIKPNLVEFQELTGKKVSSKSGVIKEARKLLNSIPLICVSSVEGGALLISEREAWYGKIPKVKIFSTVGAGDSMVGAIAHSLHRQKNDCHELLRLGLAASCATLTERGLTLGSKKEILKYYPQIFIQKMS